MFFVTVPSTTWKNPNIVRVAGKVTPLPSVRNGENLKQTAQGPTEGNSCITCGQPYDLFTCVFYKAGIY